MANKDISVKVEVEVDLDGPTIDEEEEELDPKSGTVTLKQLNKKFKKTTINKDYKETPGMEKAVWGEGAFLNMYREMVDLEKKHNVKIAVPEFLFFGFQSSGKTSTLSVVSGVPAGTMKDGTGTRCPVRYTMANSPDAKRDRIFVQGREVKDYEAQIDAVCGHMKSLADQNRFSAEIYEVRMESPKVPNMIFVDMPGMLRNDSDSKFAEWKKQLELITCELLAAKANDGESYAFIPVFVKAAHEPEEADLVFYIDDLLKRHRPKWKQDALFIINKFDRLGNMDKGEELCKNIKFLSQHGQTVFTITNPFGAHTARMTPKELTDHIQSVPTQEQEWWDKLLYELQRAYDPAHPELLEMQKSVCGTTLMKGILKNKMIEIVKKTLPMMKQQLEKAKLEKEERIAQLGRELQLGDPGKLKELIQRFNTRFLSMTKDFYHSRDFTTLNGLRQSWAGEMREFHQVSNFESKHAKMWEKDKYYVRPAELRDLLRACERTGLAAQIDMKLTSTSSLKRALDMWISMISFMHLPLYNDTDILNMSVSFDGTIQSDPWETARNLVFHASEHLRRGCIWLAEYLRYRVKTNATIIFHAAVQEFEQTGHYENEDVDLDEPASGSGDVVQLDMSERKNRTDDRMIKLLKIGKMDYDKVVDWLINGFIDTIEKIPQDQTECLNKRFVADSMQYGRALYGLWDYAVQYKFDHTDRTQWNYQGIAPVQQGPSGGRMSVFDPSAPTGNVGGPQQQAMNKAGTPTPQTATVADANMLSPPGGRGRGMGASVNKGKPVIEVDPDTEDDEPAQNYDWQRPNDEELARPAGNRDVFFFKTLYPGVQQYEFTMKHEYDVDMIYNLARVQWAAVKHHVITSVQQQMSHRLMKEIAFDSGDEQFSNATLRGWDRPQIQKVVMELAKKTNISSAQFEELIDNSPIPASKSVIQMSNAELLKAYGSDLEDKRKLRDQLVLEFKEFLDAKKNAEANIDKVKHMKIE